MPWKVVFYQTERGECPVAKFLDALSEKARAKCIGYMLLLEEQGNRLPRNYAGKVQEDLWELRPEFGGIEYRYFYFTYVDYQIVIVHAISKKSQKLKPGDIQTALKGWQIFVGEKQNTQQKRKAKIKMQPQVTGQSLQQYVAEQTENNPAFTEELARAQEAIRLGVALTEMRMTRGMTQREVSERTGIKQPMLARIERGQMPTIFTLRRIIQALDACVILLPGKSIYLEATSMQMTELAI